MASVTWCQHRARPQPVLVDRKRRWCQNADESSYAAGSDCGYRLTVITFFHSIATLSSSSFTVVLSRKFQIRISLNSVPSDSPHPFVIWIHRSAVCTPTHPSSSTFLHQCVMHHHSVSSATTATTPKVPISRIGSLGIGFHGLERCYNLVGFFLFFYRIVLLYRGRLLFFHTPSVDKIFFGTFCVHMHTYQGLSQHISVIIIPFL